MPKQSAKPRPETGRASTLGLGDAATIVGGLPYRSQGPNGPKTGSRDGQESEQSRCGETPSFVCRGSVSFLAELPPASRTVLISLHSL